MDSWQSLIDRQINHARENGDLSNLPGEGKPLKFDDQNTPDHLRMAYKILRENDLAPDWMMQSKELDEKRALLLHDLRQAAAKYHAPTGVQKIADSAWKRAQKLFREGVENYRKSPVKPRSLGLGLRVQRLKPLNTA